MENISVCIPFYNTSKYLYDCLKYILNDDFVSEIVISDDCSHIDEWDKLNEIVRNLNTDKIKLFRNEKNLGGFRNKYISILNSTSEWIYLLDSDNYFDQTTISTIKNYKNFDPNICYCPQFSVFFNDQETNIRNFDFLYEKIGTEEIKECLLNRNNDTLFSMFLNDGNFVVNREKYLKRINPIFESSENPSSACSIAFHYHWIFSGGYLKVIPIKYWHRLRLDSYWWTEGSKSIPASKKYENLFLETNMDSSKDKKISIITACKNRIDALKVSLMSWLNFKEIHEVIIVDWNSDEPIDYLTKLDPRVKVVRVSDKQYFNQPQPLNLAAKIATGDYILKVDSDHTFNPYYSAISKYFPEEKSFVCGRLNFKAPEYWSEEQQANVISDEYLSNHQNRVQYVYSYSPVFRYLTGILFVKKEYFDSVGGYNENLGDCYAYEDDEIYSRLELFGLKQKGLDLDFYFIHLPHPDKKRIENFKGFDWQEKYEELVREKLSPMHSGNELEWQVEYAISERHVEENKEKFGDVKHYYVQPKTQWNITQIDEQNYCASETKNIENNMENFPSVYCISLEESSDRRTYLNNQFKKYDIKPTFLISKRYSESNDNIIGKYVYSLNDGTKGCCASHLKMIKYWYENTDEEYAFFCEDDLSLETVDYWNFNWEQFIEKLPEDIDCIQLLTIRNEYDTFELRPRYWDDWGATAYILTREGAKKIIDTYIKGDTYVLEIPNQEIMPLIENIIFASVVSTYTIPLFVENISFKSTFEHQDNDVKEGHKNNHKISHDLILNMWKSKKQVFAEYEKIKEKVEVTEKTELEKLLQSYSLDTENPEHNFNLGVWYENQGHTAPALSYFLRCAERAAETDITLAYESLIRGSYCYFKQGTRDGSGRGMLWQAQMLLPNRPEAYFLLARYAAKQEWWQDCYSNSELGLLHCDFNLPSLRTNVEYPGKYGFLFQKAISGWWWGKVEESRSLLLDILRNYDTSESDKETIKNNLKKMGIDDVENIENNLQVKDINFNYPEDFNWSTLSYEDIVTIEREVVHEKVYRFWNDVKENDVVLDIGASVGAYVISILDQKPKKVYCVEPSENFLKVLSENCLKKTSSYSQNSLVCVNYGIVDNQNDQINIFGGEDKFIPITFKNMIERYSIDHVNYMKVDCEGGEYSIFKDENMEFLKNKVDFIAMEMHLNYSGCRKKFKEFRDKYLIQFKNYKVMSCTRQNISWGNSLDIKDRIFDDNFIDQYTCEFMIYISNK